MRHFAAIVPNQSFAKIICATRVEMSWIVLALQNIYLSEATHSLVGLPSRSSQQLVPGLGVRLRQGYGATASLSTTLRAKAGGEGS